MRNIKYIFGLITAAMTLSFVSCSKDDTVRYDNVTMGNIVDGVFVSDQGNIFNIIEQDCQIQLESMKRAITICDILKKKKDNKYDVRVKYIEDVLTKEAVPSSEQDMEAIADDPLLINEIWISGGYVNMMITVPVNLEESKRKEHKLTFIHDLRNTEEDTYRFKLSHDASGEIYNDESLNFTLARRYVSFPISSIVEGESSKIELLWNSYVVENGKITIRTESQEIKSIYRKGAFEHVLQD